MTKIIGSVVMRNEKDRYLKSCLSWAQEFLDDIFVYDDRSDDGSAEVALELGCRTVRRPESKPSFIEHEGKFRAAAWNAFEIIMTPDVGDWILSFDADEFLVADKDVRRSLEAAIESTKYKNSVGITIPFAEIFKIEEDRFYYRSDGFWNKIRGPRLFAYRHGGTWSAKPMGCGSEPEYVTAGPLSDQHKGLTMLHLGYAKDEDKKIKYDRYSSLLEHGHNDSHIASILKPSTLELWKGNVPEL